MGRSTCAFRFKKVVDTILVHLVLYTFFVLNNLGSASRRVGSCQARLVYFHSTVHTQAVVLGARKLVGTVKY